MESDACPPFIKPLKQDEDRDCDLIPILSTRQFTFQSHLTSLYMIPYKYKFFIKEFKNAYHTSIASKLITPYDWWLNNIVKIFSLQYNFLRPSPYDLRTEENDANFLPYQIKKDHHITYQKFLQYKEPANYIFFNSKYTSPFTFNSEYLIDHTKREKKLKNYDPLKQSFLLFLPNENPKRPITVPKEHLILNDDSLLKEDIPQCISDPLPPIQPIAFQPLGDCEKSYYAIAKKGYSHKELLFIISQSYLNSYKKKYQRTQKDKPRTSKEDNNRHSSTRKFSPH